MLPVSPQFGAIKVTSAWDFKKSGGAELVLHLTDKDKALSPVVPFADRSFSLILEKSPGSSEKTLKAKGTIDIIGNHIQEIEIPLNKQAILPLLSAIMENTQRNERVALSRMAKTSPDLYVSALRKTYPDIKLDNPNGTRWFIGFADAIERFLQFVSH